MTNCNYARFIYFICLNIILLAFCKTAEDVAKGDISNIEEGSLKNNSGSPDNTLTSRPQSQSSQSVIEDCKDSNFDDISSCPRGSECSSLGGGCLVCNFNCSCIYGAGINVTCTAKSGIECTGAKTFTKKMICRYCYQSPRSEYDCSGTSDCSAVSSPRKMFRANCSVKSDVVCLGNRNFLKNLPCNWTSGYCWLTALILSVTLGGFGADRFYLGHWQEGIGKLFSFGGLGVWTIIDVILIAIRYLGPANESLYI